MEIFDVVVAGGSFSGLACAQAASARGLRTLVLERKKEPGAHVRTTGILVKEIADTWDVPRSLTRKVHGVKLYDPALRSIDLVVPGYYFLATDTPALIRWLAKGAQTSGAELRCNDPYVAGQRSGKHLLLNSRQIETRYLVGCDGGRSRVARDFSLGRNSQFLIGVEAEYEGIRDIDDDRLHVFVDAQLAPGYIAWVVPGVGITQIGLAARYPHSPRLAEFTEKISALFNFDHANLIARRGGLIPCGGNVRPLSTNGVLLLGDAGGMVSPVTAGGIHPALEIGRTAGIAISDYLLDAGPDPARIVRKNAPSFFFKNMLRTCFDHAPINNPAYNWLLGGAVFRVLAKTLFFHHRGLLSPQAWREFTRTRSDIQAP
jgi:flavin-dependent dehydrogenase